MKHDLVEYVQGTLSVVLHCGDADNETSDGGVCSRNACEYPWLFCCTEEMQIMGRAVVISVTQRQTQGLDEILED